MANGVDIAKAYVQIIPSADGISGKLSEIMDGEAESAGKSAGGKFSKYFGVAAAGLAAATGAVAAFAGSSVQIGAAFDSSMSQVAATMGTTVDKIQDLRDFAMEMGSATAFSASQAADALNYMALAGYDAETSMSMLPNVLNLAAAGGIGLAEASDMVTDASSALGLSMDETSALVDKMAAASSKSNTSVAQLGSAILTIGGTAKGLAGGTTELATALGILGDNGIKGAEGGTALRNMVLSLSAPTDKAAAALASLGIEVLDAEQNMRPLEDVFADLGASLEGMGEGQKTQVLSDIFNKVDLKSANALLATSSDRWHELAAAIDDSSSAAAQMADTQLDNLNGDITLFKSALEGAQIVISDQLTPTLRGLVQFGSDAVSRLSTAFSDGGLAGAMDALGTILSDGLAMVTEQLPTFVEAGMSLLGSLAGGILDNLPLLIETALEIIVSLANGITESLPELIPTIVDVVLQIVDTLTRPDTLSALIDASIAIMLALADGLIDAIPRLIEAVPDIIENLVLAITSNGPKLVETGLRLVLKLAEGILKSVLQLAATAPQLILSLVTGIVNQFKSLIDTGARIVQSVKEGFWQKIQDAKNWGRDLIQNFLDGILEKWNRLKETVSNVAQTVKNFLGFSEPKEGPLSDFHTYAPDMMELFTSGIQSRSGSLFAAVDSVASGISKRFNNFDNLLPNEIPLRPAAAASYGTRGTAALAPQYSYGGVTIVIPGREKDAETLARELQLALERRANVWA